MTFLNRPDANPVEACFFRPRTGTEASVTWEVTNKCSLKCLHCCTEAKSIARPDELTLTEICRGIHYFATERNVKEIYFSGGEPFERPDFIRICKFSEGVGLRMSGSTAGHALTESLAAAIADLPFDFLHVSLDAATSDVHDRFRGSAGSFDHAISAISLLIRAGVTVRVNTVMSRLNVKEIKAIAAICVATGVSHLNVIPLLDIGRGRKRASRSLALEGAELVAALAELERIATDVAENLVVDCRRSHPITGQSLTRCPGGINLFHVDAGGDIHPCSILSKVTSDWRLGNIRRLEPFTASIEDAFQIFLDGRYGDVPCTSCFLSGSCGRGCPAAAGLFAGTPEKKDPLCTA